MILVNIFSKLDKPSLTQIEIKNIRQDLIATGTMGFIPNHPLVNDIVDYIAYHDNSIDVSVIGW